MVAVFQSLNFVRAYRRKDDQFVVEVYEGRDAQIQLPEIEITLS